jgi:transcriptional regulator with XRE-family HTH domain
VVDSPSLGARLRAARGRRTQAEIAEAAGISRAYLGQIEHGRRRPSTEQVRALARVLDIDATELLTVAGHIDAPAGDVPIMVTAAKAAVVRRLAALPLEVLLTLDEIGSILRRRRRRRGDGEGETGER